ncbi:hypothetical protein [Agrobacterium sp. 33MFTa1.1]|uniref:hypothetical protein n=1 Tax=Agrobacterium sp. 33MFTa1.1 TaxID=1279031 RepID=UPI000ADB96E0|nr:hypothetical protein [Agrobacterium sp. 33MFTa1.1]
MSKRELIDTGTDKRYVRRDKDGKFKESVDVSRSSLPTRATMRSMMRNRARVTGVIANTDEPR